MSKTCKPSQDKRETEQQVEKGQGAVRSPSVDLMDLYGCSWMLRLYDFVVRTRAERQEVLDQLEEARQLAAEVRTDCDRWRHRYQEKNIYRINKHIYRIKQNY